MNSETVDDSNPNEVTALRPHITVSHNPKDPGEISTVPFKEEPIAHLSVSSLGDGRNPELNNSVTDFNRSSDRLSTDKTISYSLALTFNHNKIPNAQLNGPLPFNDFKIYEHLESIAQEQVKQYGAVDLTKYELLFRLGECTIFSDNESQQTHGLTSQED